MSTLIDAEVARLGVMRSAAEHSDVYTGPSYSDEELKEEEALVAEALAIRARIQERLRLLGRPATTELKSIVSPAEVS